MNDVASGLFGLLILLASAWLFWLGAGPQEIRNKDDQLYWEARLRRRHWVSALLAAVGVCALAAGYFGHGRSWMLMWSVTPVFLVGMIGVALWDAVITRIHFTRRSEEVIRQAAQSLSKQRESQ
jgi:hypothetical protein